MRNRIIFLAAICSFSGPALACTCVPNVSVGERFDRAAYVFAAVVTRVENIRTPDSLLRSESTRMKDWSSTPRMVEGTIRVTSSFKGDSESLAAVYTHPDGATCGLTLIEGEEFLFLADVAGIVQSCGGNVARSSPFWQERVLDVQRYQAEGDQPLPSIRDLLVPPDE